MLSLFIATYLALFAVLPVHTSSESDIHNRTCGNFFPSDIFLEIETPVFLLDAFNQLGDYEQAVLKELLYSNKISDEFVFLLEMKRKSPSLYAKALDLYDDVQNRAELLGEGAKEFLRTYLESCRQIFSRYLARNRSISMEYGLRNVLLKSDFEALPLIVQERFRMTFPKITRAITGSYAEFFSKAAKKNTVV